MTNDHNFIHLTICISKYKNMTQGLIVASAGSRLMDVMSVRGGQIASNVASRPSFSIQLSFNFIRIVG